MTRDKRFYFSLLIIVVVWACSKEKKEDDINLPSTNAHIEHFGFTLVDTYWDDPTDTDTKTDYSDEVYAFSNVADMIPLAPTDNLIERINTMANLEMKVIIHLNDIFFEVVGTNSPSGKDYNLRDNFQNRWDDFVATNNLYSLQNKIAAFFIGEEPTWNGVSFQELNTATQYVKSQFPEVAIMVVEAYPEIDNLQIPTTVDWVGFDHYFIKDPSSDSGYLQEWNLLKSKRSTPDQKLVLIMDTHYIDFAHGDFGNIDLEEMKDVANNYYKLAKSEPSVIAILGYFWPNGFDAPESIGARNMPQFIKNEYLKIGKEITGKD